MTRKNSFFSLDRLPTPSVAEDIDILMRKPIKGKDGRLHGTFETAKEAGNHSTKSLCDSPLRG
jgi:hypothetical protein